MDKVTFALCKVLFPQSTTYRIYNLLFHVVRTLNLAPLCYYFLLSLWVHPLFPRPSDIGRDNSRGLSQLFCWLQCIYPLKGSRRNFSPLPPLNSCLPDFAPVIFFLSASFGLLQRWDCQSSSELPFPHQKKNEGRNFLFQIWWWWGGEAIRSQVTGRMVSVWESKSCAMPWCRNITV